MSAINSRSNQLIIESSSQQYDRSPGSSNYNPYFEAAPITEGSAKATWKLVDIVVLAMVFSTVLAIVSVPIIPIAPSVFLPFIAWYLLFRNKPTLSSYTLIRLPEIKILGFMFVYEVIGLILSRGAQYATISLGFRIIASFLFVLCLARYIISSPHALRRCWAVAFISCILSAIWYLGEYALEEPFMSWRMQLYQDIYAEFPDEKIQSIRSGLAPFPHLLGYQLAFLVPMLFLPVSRSNWSIVWRSIGSVIALIALSFSNQRSAAAAAAVAFVLIAFYTGKRGLLIRLLFLSLAGFLAYYLVSASGFWDTSGAKTSLSEKLILTEYWEEAAFRMELQLVAVKLIFINPLGLNFAGLDWLTAGFWPTFMNHPQLVISDTMSVHNGYLGLPLEIGLPFLLMTGALLWLLLKRIYMVISTNLQTPISPYINLMTATAAGVLFAHSTTHNGSFLSQEPTSLICLAYVLAAETLRRTRRLHER